ncbi:uncharacterized protein LOC134281127 [Saccostrea cucullata]|uniref:uncharacterized protein LOC134281127 n=1 Tax=Saccostrea cuccullata TaxID=36930 RepID=UPI002ED24446
MIAGDILGEVPPTTCTIDDVRSEVFSTRFQHVVTERDLEDVVEILNNRRIYEMNVYLNEEHLEHYQYTERDERLPPPGTRVRRGPRWTYNNQNSDGLGTIIGHWDRDGWMYVEWDNTMRFPYEYNPNDQKQSAVIVCDEPRILRREDIAVGCVVKRGPDWKWGNQDGGIGNIGAVYRVKDDVVYVRWPNGNKSNYRFGHNGKFDIEVCDPFDVSRVVSSHKCENVLKHTSEEDFGVKNKTQARTEKQLESFVKREITVDGKQRVHSESVDDLDCDKDKSDFSWEWKTENGQWKRFSKTENEKIIKAFEKNSKSTILIRMGEQMYRVILSKMTLLNISTRETYDVRCRENVHDLQA